MSQAAPPPSPPERTSKRDVVRSTAERLRHMILAEPPDAQIGSLPTLAKALGVGVVTVQQAARILEHEGLLAVRRGPGGGYYGARPDAAALERSVAAYLRVRASDAYEALEMMTLLDCELVPLAAVCTAEPFRAELRALRARVERCASAEQRMDFEEALHDALFRQIDRPLMELLARVSMRYHRSQPIPTIFEGVEGFEAWRAWRGSVLDAMLGGDAELGRFEAERHRRRLLERLKRPPR